VQKKNCNDDIYIYDDISDRNACGGSGGSGIGLDKCYFHSEQLQISSF